MIKYLEDGSVLIPVGTVFMSKFYAIDPDNPQRYIPKYSESCVHRRFELKTLSCGKCHGIWMCDKKKESTCVTDCNACTLDKKA